MNAEMNRRILTGWMRAGVTIQDPATTWVHASVDLAPDVTLLPGTSLEGATSVGAGATIGPEVSLKDVEVGEGATVVRTHGELSVIGAGAEVGPYARLRPGTRLGAKGKIGTFVETKNARSGDRSKVPHQSYVGDAEIGVDVNVGAGVIFANYDGVTKSTTVVGDHSFVGSNAVLAAPLVLGTGTFVAAGSTITGDVEPGDLAVARGVGSAQILEQAVMRVDPGGEEQPDDHGSQTRSQRSSPAAEDLAGAGEQRTENQQRRPADLQMSKRPDRPGTLRALGQGQPQRRHLLRGRAHICLFH
jgi:UDP-N-acetylglucosamine diphosphorylase/glucosamine-1-phosphate N-acetyltransferase